MIVSSKNWQRAKLGNDVELSRRVAELIDDIALHGDSAINRLSERFDRFAPQWVALKPFDDYALDSQLKAAIQLAATRIKRFAEFQKQSLVTRSFSDEYGEYSQIVAPIERIAAYIPGGKAPLISTALMTLIPATIAGCPLRVAMSPSLNEALLAAASLAGATHFLRIGGTQAIAAAAFGYDKMLACDMVVGPGNAYVAEAKSQLQRRIKIDTVAGPSEVLIVVDDDTPIDWIIADAYAQSEHGDDASVVIVSCSEHFLQRVAEQINADAQGARLLRREQIQLVHAYDALSLIEFCNRYAPEHLQWCAPSIDPLGLKHFGALFVGAQSPVALGDYITGPNHTLPTMGSARRTAGLSVSDFLRVQTQQKMYNASTLYESAATLADAEGLSWHANSLRLRQ